MGWWKWSPNDTRRPSRSICVSPWRRMMMLSKLSRLTTLFVLSTWKHHGLLTLEPFVYVLCSCFFKLTPLNTEEEIGLAFNYLVIAFGIHCLLHTRLSLWFLWANAKQQSWIFDGFLGVHMQNSTRKWALWCCGPKRCLKKETVGGPSY